VRFGDINLSTDRDDEFVQEVRVTKIVQHPKYVRGVAYFDVAVLETTGWFAIFALSFA
jgi:hypothetical protein